MAPIDPAAAAAPLLLTRLGLGDAAAWRLRWRRRLESLPQPPVIDERLLWGFALPLLSGIEQGLQQMSSCRPVVALTAPVGAGKSTLARQLQRLSAAIGINLAVASIDDAYRHWAERQQALAGNPFGVNRVPPGSHDPALLQRAIDQWRTGGDLILPRFDKTLRAGQGDRCGDVLLQADALLLEGWLVGYEPVTEARLSSWLIDQQHGACAQEDLSPAEIAWLPRWNRALHGYVPLWHCCDRFWVLEPKRWSQVQRWRLQAEARQRRTGAQAMTAGAVQQMVRATLASLPPGLYQPDLVSKATAVAMLGARRQCLGVDPLLA